MAFDPDPDQLRKLEQRIAKAKGIAPQGPEDQPVYSQAQHAWRMVIELVSGLLIGFAIGYGLDRLFGTTPVLIVIFTLLGFAAGVRVMIRTAQELQNSAQAATAATNEGNET
jgi:ATP synthase protein I